MNIVDVAIATENAFIEPSIAEDGAVVVYAYKSETDDNLLGVYRIDDFVLDDEEELDGVGNALLYARLVWKDLSCGR